MRCFSRQLIKLQYLENWQINFLCYRLSSCSFLGHFKAQSLFEKKMKDIRESFLNIQCTRKLLDL